MIKSKVEELEVNDNFELINKNIDYSKYIKPKRKFLEFSFKKIFISLASVASIILIMIVVFNTRSVSSQFNETKRYRVQASAEQINAEWSDIHNQMNDGMNDFINKLEIFSNKLTVSIFNELLENNQLNLSTYDNYCISPVSIYMGLAMAIECAKGETRDEMLNAVGVTYEEVVRFTKYLYDLCNEEEKEKTFSGNKTMYFEHLANSIWVDEQAVLKPEGLERLSTIFHSATYQAPFKNNTKSASKAVNDYITRMTGGLVKPNIEYNPMTAFMLVNTYYLKDMWQKEGKELSYSDDVYSFIEYDNDVEEVRLLKGKYADGKAYESVNYRAFYIRTYYGNILTFVVPKDGYTINDIYTIENMNNISNIEYVTQDLILEEEYFTRCLFPKFEAGFNGDIKDVLIDEFGVKKLFTQANLTNIMDETYIDTYCMGYNHQTNLKVDEIGIEGSAATEIPMFGATSPGQPLNPVYLDFVVDRNFIFNLTDSYGNPLFTGVIMEI